MIQFNDARKLCSMPEWKLLESSFPPVLQTLARSDLKSQLDRTRKLYRKTEELVSLQHSESRKQITRRKHSMFAEAIDRFRDALNLKQNAGTVERVSKSTDTKVLTKKSIVNMDALQKRDNKEFSDRKTESLSALIDHGRQQMSKSGARGVQGHVGSANRRQQGRRDGKNR